jgi:hypothetical protein
MRKYLLAGLLLLATLLPVGAQTLICFKSATGSGCTPVASAAPLPVTVISGGGGGAVTLASGAVASGAYAAGALAAGAFATGAGVDGWDLTQGAKADAAWTTGSGSVISLLKAIAGAEIAANRSVNVAQINGITPLMGNGVTGTGSPRVTIASDNTAFTVNAAQSGAWVPSPSASSTFGITPVASGSAGASLVLKAGAGNFYSGSAVNTTATAGFCLVVNATSAPSTGAAVTPLLFAVLPANGSCSLGVDSGIPSVFSTGITFLVSSNASPFTFTSGTITAAISGKVQ